VVAAIVVLSVVVLVLGAWLWASRSALSAASLRGDELADRLETATRESEVAASDALEARTRADAERGRADAAEAEVADATARAERARREADESGRALREAQARAARAEERSRAPLDPLGLWALEAVRLDRVWRDHAVPGPGQASPFAGTGDPARSAIEILAGALREQSGTSVEVNWEPDQPIPPAPAAWLVRAVEELLGVARASDSGRLDVEVDGDDVVVSLRTDPPVPVPLHLIAALEAASLRPAAENGALTLRVVATGEAQGWDVAEAGGGGT
jgi:hypothetical protein